MAEKRHEFEAPGITVGWSRDRCIHVAECVRGLPAVFEPGRRPWVDPARATADRVAEVVRRCPSGALHYVRRDGGEAEAVPETNVVVPSADGPLYLRGDIAIETADATPVARDTRVALCRCGRSRHKPFCDAAHWEAGFQDRGNVGAGGTPAEGEAGHGELQVTLSTGGPYVLQGRFVLASARGGKSLTLRGASLCRCGGSANKPFCDGTHRKPGFAVE